MVAMCYLSFPTIKRIILMIMYNATIPRKIGMTYVMTSIALAAITRNAINTKKRRSNIITLSFFAHQSPNVLLL